MSYEVTLDDCICRDDLKGAERISASLVEPEGECGLLVLVALYITKL